MRCDVCGQPLGSGRFCGRCGAVLDSPVDRDNDAHDRTDTDGDTRSRVVVTGHARRSPIARVGVAIVTLVAAMLVVGALERTQAPSPPDAGPVALPSGQDVPPSDAPTDDHAGGLEQEPALEPLPVEMRGPVGLRAVTDAVLVLDAGTDRIVVIELDTGAQTQLPDIDPHNGKQRFRLERVGDALVVARRDSVVVRPGSAPWVRTIGAGEFVPGADPDELWLVERERDPGFSTWRLVDGDSTRAELVAPSNDHEPLHGVIGGLAVRAPDGGLLRIDAATNASEPLFGEDVAWIGGATQGGTVSCIEEPCDTVRVTRPEGGALLVGGDETFRGDRVWLSPDGQYLGAVVSVASGGGVELRVRVYATASGAVVGEVEIPYGRVYGDWDATGERFFAVLDFQGGGPGSPLMLATWSAAEGLESVDIRERISSEVVDMAVMPAAWGHALFTPPRS